MDCMKEKRNYLESPKPAIYRGKEKQTMPGLNGSAVSSRVAMLMVQSLVARA